MSLNIVNINRASKEMLQGIPGIGPVRAELIASFRELYGQVTKDNLLMLLAGRVTSEMLSCIDFSSSNVKFSTPVSTSSPVTTTGSAATTVMSTSGNVTLPSYSTPHYAVSTWGTPSLMQRRETAITQHTFSSMPSLPSTVTTTTLTSVPMCTHSVDSLASNCDLISFTDAVEVESTHSTEPHTENVLSQLLALRQTMTQTDLVSLIEALPDVPRHNFDDQEYAFHQAPQQQTDVKQSISTSYIPDENTDVYRQRSVRIRSDTSPSGSFRTSPSKTVVMSCYEQSEHQHSTNFSQNSKDASQTEQSDFEISKSKRKVHKKKKQTFRSRERKTRHGCSSTSTNGHTSSDTDSCCEWSPKAKRSSRHKSKHHSTKHGRERSSSAESSVRPISKRISFKNCTKSRSVSKQRSKSRNRSSYSEDSPDRKRHHARHHKSAKSKQTKCKHRHRSDSSSGDSSSPSHSRLRKDSSRHKKSSRKSTNYRRRHRSTSSESSSESSDERSKRRGNPRKLPKTLRYDGTSSWLSFRHQFESYRSVLGWTDSECRDYLTWSLQGKALDFFTIAMRYDNHYSFRKIMKKLENRFGNQDLAETSRMKFRQTYQSYDETLEDWADRVMTLADSAFRDYPGGHGMQETVAKFCQGCVDKEAGKHACLSKPKSMQEALNAVKQHQYISKAMDRHSISSEDDVSVNTVDSTCSISEARVAQMIKEALKEMTSQFLKMSKSHEHKKSEDEVQCFFCKRMGHTRRDCSHFHAWLEKKKAEGQEQ